MDIAGILHSTLRASTPLIFAAFAALICDHAGIINVALEGAMLIAAFFGVLSGSWSGSGLIGGLIGVLAAVAIMMLMAFLHLRVKANAVLVGISLNLIVSGSTVYMLYMFTGEKGVTTSLNVPVFKELHLGISEIVPGIGNVFDDQCVLTYMALSLPLFVYFFLNRTKFGLCLKAVGEAPESILSAGKSVGFYKTMALIIAGILSGLGGVYLSMYYVSWFARDMTAGRGFIALAAQALGNRSVVGTLGAAILFGFSEILGYEFQILSIPWEIAMTLPFVLVLLSVLIYGRRKLRLSKG